MSSITISPGPANASTDPRTGLRSYLWQGKSYPSVTSIRRMAGVPHGLVAWQVSQVVKRATIEADTLNAMLTRERKPRERVLESNRIAEAGRWLRAAATEERDRSAALGTAVHDAAASGLRPEDVDDEVRPRLRQYLDFLEVSGAEVVASEFQVVNTAVGYAGSCDALLKFKSGAIWVVDYKTGRQTFSEYALQLMAYKRGEHVFVDDTTDDATTQLLHSAVGMAVLHLADDGWEFQIIRDDEETWDAFVGLAAFAKWMQAHQEVGSVIVNSRKSHEREVINKRIDQRFRELREVA